MPDNVAIFAIVILLVPMMYFLIAAPSFLLVSLDIRPVALLLRGMFNGYFLTLMVAGAVGAFAVFVEGRLLLTLGIALIAVIAARSRRWYLAQIDARLSETEASGAGAARDLRRLHWRGMLSNAVQLVVLVACIPLMATT